jgi:HEAT repeat protein
VATPRDRVRQACSRDGERAVALWCAALLAGQAVYDESIVTLGGAHAEAVLDGREKPDFWPRLWAARGLLYAWAPEAAPAVVGALDDDSWRIREMALKVVRLRELGEASDAAAELTGDEVERVRKAAVRALARIGEAEHAEAVRDLLDDPFAGRDAEITLREMSRRLDRPL